MFVGIHALLALNLKVPELEITQEEGDQFIKASQNVMRHYSVTTTQKTLDWIALFGVGASIYGPRVVAIMNNRSKSDAPRPAQRTVVPFPQQMNSVPRDLHIQPDMTGDIPAE